MATRTLNDDGTISYTFTATETWNKPAGTLVAEKIVTRGGGGNAGVSQLAGAFKGGSAGAGAYAHSLAVAIPNASYVVTVPAAGAAGDVSFGSLVIAKRGGNGGDSTALAHGAAGAAGTAAASTGATKFSGGVGRVGGSNAPGGGGGAGDAGDGAAAPAGVPPNGAAGGTAGGGDGGSGGTLTVPPEDGTAPGGGGGSPNSNLDTPGQGARGEVVVTVVETGNQQAALTPTATVAIAATGADLFALSQAATVAIAETGGITALLTPLRGSEALAETNTQIALLTPLRGSEAIAVTQDQTIIITPSRGSEALAETNGITVLIVPSRGSESLAEVNGIAFVIAPSRGSEAISEAKNTTVLLVGSGPWRLMSPGLSGTAYEETGTTPIVGAEVLVFRDDTHALVGTLTSDANGDWAIDLNPFFTYWLSYYLGPPGPAATGWRTDEGIVTVETEIASGTSS